MNNFYGLLNGLGVVAIVFWIMVITAFIVTYFLGLYAVYIMAKKRGRMEAGWTILALFTTPLIGMLLLACLGETDDQENQRIYREELIRESARRSTK